MAQLTDKDRELAAVGAAIAAGCHPCTQHHVRVALDSGLSAEEVRQAIDAAHAVRREAGVGAVRAGQTPVATAVSVAHETAHAVQSLRLGGADLRRVGRDTFRRHERQARLAHESFEEYLCQCWDIVDCALDAPRLVRWAKLVLSGRRGPAWTAPASLMG